MRIFIGGIATETNTFSPILMDCEFFQKAFWLVGKDVEQARSSTKETRGTYDYLASQEDVEIIPGFIAHGTPAGNTKAEYFQKMQDLLLRRLRAAMPVDGVVLNMHGAMVAEGCFDCEGDTFEKIREIVGPDIPITSSFDLHGCITPKMVACLDGMAAFQTYPHVDHQVAGYHAAEACVRLVREKIRPQKLYHTLPLIMAVENCNTEAGPIIPAINMVRELLRHPDVLSGGLNLNHQWMDVPDLGCQITMFVRPDADTAEIDRRMKEILSYIWEKRYELRVDVPSMEETLQTALTSNAPVHISDLGDIVSAGGPGDSTVALRALLHHPELRPACVHMVDPATIEKAQETGLHNSGDFSIGGTPDHGYNTRVGVHAAVMRFNDEIVYPLGITERGLPTDMGMRVLLKTEDDLYIIVSQYASCNHDRAMLLTMGLDPAKMRVIIQKTHQMFKEGFRDTLGTALYADTEGFTDRNLHRMPFRHIHRPIFPLDDFTPETPPVH